MNSKTTLGTCLVVVLAALAGCGGSSKKAEPYFTSGSHDADQRAEQRIAQAQQARGDDKDEKETPRGPLFDRLGGDVGVKAIVDDFVARALADPRVNWSRKGLKGGGFVGIGDRSVEWQPTAANVESMKKHLAQFLSVATGGPTRYEGRDMTAVHKGLKITNAEFDAALGDLKSTLDKLGVATAQQRELLAIIESTRPQVVESR